MTEGEEFDVDVLNPENSSPEIVIPMDSLREPPGEPTAVSAKPVVEIGTSDVSMLDVHQAETPVTRSQPGNQSAAADGSKSQMLDHLRASGESPTGREIVRRLASIESQCGDDKLRKRSRRRE